MDDHVLGGRRIAQTGWMIKLSDGKFIGSFYADGWFEASRYDTSFQTVDNVRRAHPFRTKKEAQEWIDRGNYAFEVENNLHLSPYRNAVVLKLPSRVGAA